MIKVEHTKVERLIKNLIGGNTVDVLVTDAELVLVDILQAPNEICVNGRYCHSILISEIEKIEVGELFAHYWYDNEYSTERNQKRILISTADAHTNDIKHRKNYIGKILALPEHFSPEQLQMIVDGKLKEGKCLVECEDKCWCMKPQSGGCIECIRLIKLNPLTIYPVKQKMYTKKEMIDLVNEFLQDEALDDVDFESWLKKKIKS